MIETIEIKKSRFVHMCIYDNNIGAIDIRKMDDKLHNFSDQIDRNNRSSIKT